MPSNSEPVDLARGTETVPLVEDEPPVRSSVRSMVVRILFEQHSKVPEAANGEEELRVVGSHADRVIDLPLSDVMMPQMGGIAWRSCPLICYARCTGF